MLSWLLLLFIPLSNQAALLPPPKPQKPLLPPINKKSNRIINQVPIPPIVIVVLVQSIIIDVQYKRIIGKTDFYIAITNNPFTLHL